MQINIKISARVHPVQQGYTYVNGYNTTLSIVFRQFSHFMPVCAKQTHTQVHGGYNILYTFMAFL